MYFNINDVFDFSTDESDSNHVKNHKEFISLGEVETVQVFTTFNRILILSRNEEESDYLFGFDLNGNLIFKTEPPEHYVFWYLCGKQVACKEADEFADKSPLSGWWFFIDLNNGNLIKGFPAY